MKIITVSRIVLIVLMFSGRTGARYFDSDPPIELRLIRNFGYGGVGKIQGRFTLKVSNPNPDLAEVDFFLDDDLIGSSKTRPFQISFQTDDFPPGKHSFSARGNLSDGTALDSTVINKTFLSSEEAWQETGRLVLPILILVFGLTAAGTLLPFLLNRNKKFQPGMYGPAGGAVCPRCELPYSRPYLAPNLLVGKLVRCPHCGKISIQPGAGWQQLEEAEQRYKVRQQGEFKQQTPEDDLRELVENSRFEE